LNSILDTLRCELIKIKNFKFAFSNIFSFIFSFFCMYACIYCVNHSTELTTRNPDKDIVFLLAFTFQFLIYLPHVVCSNANRLIGLEKRSEFIKYHNLGDFANSEVFIAKNILIFLICLISANIFNLLVIALYNYAYELRYLSAALDYTDIYRFYLMTNLSLISFIPLIVVHSLIAFKFKYINTLVFIAFTFTSLFLNHGLLQNYIGLPYSTFLFLRKFCLTDNLGFFNLLKTLGASFLYLAIIIIAISTYKKYAKNKALFFKA
jgi:hypothetical protein